MTDEAAAPGGRLDGRLIGLGVCGSIAAYKAVELLRRLTAEGADVVVMLTPSATRFVGPLTFEALSRHPVETDVLDLLPDQRIGHIVIADTADAIVVAPATARWLGAMAGGIADDAVLAACLATSAPVVVAPAMDGDMWTHPATRDQRRAPAARVRLPGRRARGGAARIGPVGRRPARRARRRSSTRSSRPSRTRPIRQPDAAARPPIVDRLGALDLEGRRIVVTAGGTAEPIDPVRFIGNRSSGKMGIAIAEAAAGPRRARHADRRAHRGPGPAGHRRRHAPSRPRPCATRSLDAVFDGRADALVMAAAVADFRPAHAGIDQAHPRRRPDASSSSRPRTSWPRSARRAGDARPAAGHRRLRGRDRLARAGAREAAPQGRRPPGGQRRRRGRDRGSAPRPTGSRSWAPTGRATTCRC